MSAPFTVRHAAVSLLTALLVAAPLAGCASDDNNDDGAGSGGDATPADAAGSDGQDDGESGAQHDGGAAAAPRYEPPGVDLDALAPPAQGTVTVIEPGGETVCSRGTPFRFFGYGGDTKKLVLDFRGGGACWDQLTCSVQDAIFQPEAPSEDEVAQGFAEGSLEGIYRLDDARNPVQGWSLIHVPYCTGDIHWGDATHDYGGGLEVEHRGFVNAQTVIAWAHHHYPDATDILVTGCSAGAYGAIGHAAYVADRWPNAQIRVVADAGAGVITDDFFANSFPNWNAEPALPFWLPGLEGKEIDDLDIVDLYIAVATAYPNMRIAQHTAAYDRDQRFYYTAMGGNGDDWNGILLSKLQTIDDATDNFSYYVAQGPVHCLHVYDVFYDREVGGVAYTDWLDDILTADELPTPVACTADGCLSDPICEACKTDEDAYSACFWCSDWNGG